MARHRGTPLSRFALLLALAPLTALAQGYPAKSIRLIYPTFREALPDYQVPTAWYGLFGVAGTPRPIIMRIYTEMAAAVQSGESRAWLEQYFHTGVGNTPDEFAQIYLRDYESWGRAVKAAGVRPE